MNPVQEAVAKVFGLESEFEMRDGAISDMTEIMEALASDQTMLQRQIEDLDYLNLFESGDIIEVLPIKDRARVVARLRRLRHDNPLAKQAVKLVVRFTLGRGVQWIIADEAPKTKDLVDAATSQLPPVDGETKTPPSKPPPSGTKIVQIPRAARANEADDPNTVVDDQEETPLDTEKVRKAFASFWKAADNQLAFTKHNSTKTMLDDIVTDGEKFYACFEGPAEPYVKAAMIPLEEITQIIYDPDNRLKPVFYKRQYTKKQYDGQADMYKPIGNPQTVYYYDYRILEEDQDELRKSIKIPKSKISLDAKIKHVMINEVETKNGKRGVSELYASREWFRVFREFMEGRASINAAAHAISYLRKIKGGPTSVARFGGKFGGLDVGDSPPNGSSELRKLTKPVQGAIYDTNEAVDLEFMKADTGAVNAKEDARMLLMTAGAGMGTMVHYFGEGGDANLATAQSMELPMVKNYEDWQQFIEDFFRDWFEYVIRVAFDQDTAEQALERLGFNFPPIIAQDIVKATTAWSQIVRDIAPNNMAVRRQAIKNVLNVMGVSNIDGMMAEIEAEMAKAEAQRVQQQDQMMKLAASQPTGVGPNAVSDAPTGPGGGMDPNTKKLVKGRGEKVSNGPKSA